MHLMYAWDKKNGMKLPNVLTRFGLLENNFKKAKFEKPDFFLLKNGIMNKI